MFSFWIPVAIFAIFLLLRRVSMYTLKFTLIGIWYSTMMGLIIPFVVFSAGNIENNAILKHSAKFCGLKYELRGAEYIDKEESCVYVGNHQSAIDMIGLQTFWDLFGKMSVAGKASLKYAGTFGLAAALNGNIFIERNSGKKTGQQLNEAMVKLKRENTKLMIFPEGTRRNTGEIHQFKKGAFYAAIHAQVPIMPVVNSSYRSFLNAEEKKFESGEVIVEVLPKISTEGLTDGDVDWLIEKTRNAMIECFKRNSAEIDERVQKRQKIT